MHETLQLLTKTLALRLPPSTPAAPQETLVDAIPEIIPRSPVPDHREPVEAPAASSSEPIEVSGVLVSEQQSVSGEASETSPTAVAETPKKPTHKKRGSMFGFLWPFGGSSTPVKEPETAPKPDGVPARSSEAAALTALLTKTTIGVSVGEVGHSDENGA